MKMLDIVNAEKALRKLVNADLPIKKAFELSLFVDEIDKQLNKFEKFRVDLVTKFGEKDDNGNVKVEKEMIDLFNKEMNDLLDADVNIEVKPISIDDFMAIDGLVLSIVELKALKNIGLVTM